ncbi:hypothetical protein CHARACLAT_028949, partial [Characodon lateralis]|nr:hypothetical protein [Characodon lateralis]
KEERWGTDLEASSELPDASVNRYKNRSHNENKATWPRNYLEPITQPASAL